ncbi:MAG: CheY-like chemotaxis protein [Vicingaceae bacterium]|jgi:CheY-like chemotaxis protein
MEKFKNVLLIDDSISSNQYNRILINELDIADNIFLANSADQALEYLLGGEEANYPKPNLILLDIAMPQMDGFMFLEEYAKLPAEATNNWKTVIAIVSDNLDANNFEKSKQFKTIGVLEHIKKPLDNKDIVNLIEEHFE